MVKNMTCNVANDCGFRRLRKILYADKRGDFNFDSSSVLKKQEATQCFATVIAKAQNVSLFLKIDFNFNISLLKPGKVHENIIVSPVTLTDVHDHLYQYGGFLPLVDVKMGLPGMHPITQLQGRKSTK